MTPSLAADRIAIAGDVRGEIVRCGYAWIPSAAWSIGGALTQHWQRLREDWDHLELDGHLRDGATFRRRRYGRYYWSPPDDAFLAMPNEPYFQPEDENAYAGGVSREFAPLLPQTIENPFLAALVRATFACLPLTADRRNQTWEVRIHQIRIEASADQPGEPAPEGIHQDGTDFLTLHLVRRRNIAGAETTIYDLNRTPLQSYTFRHPLDSFILEDPRILHGVTPAYPADPSQTGIRDLLGIDFIASPTLARPGATL